MHSMGTVLKYDSKGNLIAKLSGKPPKLGTIVSDETGKRIGRVSDVIGNEKSPYLVIKTSRKDEISSIYMGEKEKK